MIIEMSFAELSEYIKNRYNKKLSFSKAGENEVRISYGQNILFKTIQIPVNIRVDEVKDETITVTYNGGLGIDLIITGALTFLKAKLPELTRGLKTEEGHRINIDLRKIEQLGKLVEAVTFTGISINEGGIRMEASLK